MATPDLLAGTSWVTDGGLETDLLFHRGFDLPAFAAFPLLDDAAGRAALTSYYGEYVAIADAAGAGLILETPTWRANADWGATLGYGPADLDRLNQDAVALTRSAGSAASTRSLVSGAIGPRGDGYQAGSQPAEQAAEYHLPQLRSFAVAGADLVHALTMTTVAEAVGVVRSARHVGLPVAISFTVETDGRLPDGCSLGEAVETVEAKAPADWYGVNCAHPTHLAQALTGQGWQDKLSYFRPNASTRSHAELDEMEVLDTGDLNALDAGTRELRDQLVGLRVLGGCCGTDSRHVARLWGTSPPRRA